MSHGSTSKILAHVGKCPRFWDIYKHIHQNLQNLTKNAFYYYLSLSPTRDIPSVRGGTWLVNMTTFGKSLLHIEINFIQSILLIITNCGLLVLDSTYELVNHKRSIYQKGNKSLKIFRKYENNVSQFIH